MTTLNEYIAHYDNHYSREGESGSGQLVWKPQYEMWLKAGYKPSMSVLDYGCGVGIMLEAGIKHYLGVDISENAIKLARKRYPKAKFEVFTPGELNTPIRDIVVAQSVFTHTPKKFVPICLDEIKRHFTKFAIIDVLIGRDDAADKHVRYFRVNEWQRYLQQAGLIGKRLGEIDFVGFKHVYYKVEHDY